MRMRRKGKAMQPMGMTTRAQVRGAGGVSVNKMLGMLLDAKPLAKGMKD